MPKQTKHRTNKLSLFLQSLSRAISRWTGSSSAFMLALGSIFVWACLGPLFDYSDTWQLVINTGTTIITFLMVFLIQRAQNRDSSAIQLKLNELIASTKGASNRLVLCEDISEEDLEVLRDYYCRLAKLCEKDVTIRASHSIDEAESKHLEKMGDNKSKKGR